MYYRLSMRNYSIYYLTTISSFQLFRFSFQFSVPAFLFPFQFSAFRSSFPFHPFPLAPGNGPGMDFRARLSANRSRSNVSLHVLQIHGVAVACLYSRLAIKLTDKQGGLLRSPPYRLNEVICTSSCMLKCEKWR